METPVATILSVRDTRALVEVAATAVCARCAAGKGCGAGVLPGGRLTTLEVDIARGIAVQPGDRVCLNLDPADLLRASLLAYGLPLTGMALALAILRMFSNIGSDLIAVVTALAGLLGGLLTGRYLLLRDRRCARHLVPTITRVATASEASGAVS